MSTSVLPDRIAMSQHERDILKIMQPVLTGQRTQAEAAYLLDLSVRQVRRIQRRLEADGDAAVVHGLRGRPSNHQPDLRLKRRALRLCRKKYHDFGPTLASEKLHERHGLTVCPQTLRRWMAEDGLWQRKRRRPTHRSRRPRRACFGELVQFDASIHDWLEGRGEEIVLISLIDDATSTVLARFYPAGTVETHMDLLGRWLRTYGRPLALYTDRHSIFEAQNKGRAVSDGVTQFGRALSELGVELIRAHSPQAKGRVERSFGTAQDRWVKELRLAKATTLDQANETLARILPEHNRRFARAARESGDAHRELGPGHDLDAILSIQSERTVSNDYVVRFGNRFYQLKRPALSGLRGGKVVVEERLDGSLHIRFKGRYVRYDEITRAVSPGGSAPKPPEFAAWTADASGEGQDSAPGEGGRAGVQPAGGRSGCTPAEPYPPDGEAKDSARAKGRPAQDHPWRRPFKPQK